MKIVQLVKPIIEIPYVSICRLPIYTCINYIYFFLSKKIDKLFSNFLLHVSASVINLSSVVLPPIVKISISDNLPSLSLKPNSSL